MLSDILPKKAVVGSHKLAKNRISVVIPARQSQATIRTCINSILSQSIAPFEVIVVSTVNDPTKKAIQKFIKAKKVRYIAIEQDTEYVRDAHLKRWIGAKNSNGNYIFFTDSKATLEHHALEISLKLAIKQKAHAVAGIAESWESDKHLFVSKIQDKAILKNNPRFSPVEWLTRYNFGKKESLPVTTALLISRKAFESIRGDFGLEYSKVATTYDDYVTAWLLVKHGFPILLTNSVKSYHKHRTNFWSYTKQISRSGQSAALLNHYYPDCPFGKRRLIEVGIFFLALFTAVVSLAIVLPIFGWPAILVSFVSVWLFFLILGVINVFLEKDLSAIFIPPITGFLIALFSYHFVIWFFRTTRINQYNIDSYLQIN